MKKRVVVILVILLLLLGGFLVYRNRQNKKAEAPLLTNDAIKNTPMKIQSPEFGENQTIPIKYTCDGDGTNPPLEFKDVPNGTQSLTLVVNDPDAPNGNWVHWVVWNMPPETNKIGENSVPSGATAGKTSSGQNNYGGPCPPSGTHRYIFTLYALKEKLSLPSYSTADDLVKAMEGRILEQTQLTGLYNRNK